MSAWEYAQFSVSSPASNRASTLDALNRMGKQGWELVAVTSTGVVASFFFKRPLPSTEEA